MSKQLFEDKKVQDLYVKERDSLITLYGGGCSRVRVFPLLIQQKNKEKPILVLTLVFERENNKEDIIEVNDNITIVYNTKLNEEDTEELSEIITL